MNPVGPHSGPDDAATPGAVRRRTIAQGMAWTAPAVIAAASAPAIAASCSEHGTYTHGPGLGSVTIPACVTTVTFTLIGGGGGGSSVRGGHAAKITGTLQLPGTAATLLSFDIGYGGDGRNALQSSPTSGRGYGDGGLGGIRFFNAAWRVDGGDGGGGSAILVNTVPIVVAGAGGGSGNGSSGQGTGTVTVGQGGDAAPSPTNGGNAVLIGSAGTRRDLEGGGAANGLTGGTAGDSGIVSSGRRVGQAGSNGPGGNGGAGGSFVDGDAANAGGGGGGYAGGGGGEAGKFALDGNDMTAGAGGGAGSCYAGGGSGITVTANVVSANNGGAIANGLGGINPMRGLHGSVTLTW